ncbi:thrombomodulin-like [Lates calcarifer]|uniref:Thrombomodulin n=1 Tax=Lates calcarifer TaxID=8187 RepID=A0AAJ7VEW5_LATCA|nr:thrombomodulin-like [Lates calcarifer]
MKDLTGLFVVVVLVFLSGGTVETVPDSGYCIVNQCFTVVQDPIDFTTARDQCRGQGGHLMTVRSSVSHDVLYILLGNFTGQFWIGLHLLTGCPDAAAGLKGFQWVTKDNESDFFNWAPGFDSSCSSHRCVSVSKESDFKWTQEPCGEQAAGFLCEFSFSEPCKSLAVTEGETVSYMTPMGFGGEDMLSLPPGSIATRMPSESKYLCFSEQWLQAPWNCEILEGGCEHKCVENPKEAPSCYCPAGQSVNPANNVTCDVVPDDPCAALGCEHACYKDGDSHVCICDHGFKLAADGRSCVDFNDCTDQRQCPGENFRCINTVGGFQCVCKEGYSLSGSLCVDQDECASAPCEHMCDNTPGSYKCSCYDGHIVDPKSPNKCKLHCGEEECDAQCDPNDVFQCYCPDGYVKEERDEGAFCIDIDECSFFYCDQGCVNTFGSYVCSCNPGFTLVGEYRCVKDDKGTVTDGGMGGKTAATTPDIPTTPSIPPPDPTRQPSGVTVGGLVGIIVCTVFFIVLIVFLAHHFLNRGGKMESAGALKAHEDEGHSLHRVTSDTS